MEVLQQAVHPFSPISASATRTPSLIPPASTSFTPICSLAAPFSHHHAASLPLPLQARPLPNPPAGVGASVVRGCRPKSFLLIRHSAAAGYAAALVEIGRSKRVLDRIHTDLRNLAFLLQHKYLCSLLLDPSIRDGHKLKVFKRLADEAAFLPYTRAIVDLMIEKKRTAHLKDLVQEFEVIYRTIASTKNPLMWVDRAHSLPIITEQIPDMPMDSLSETANTVM